MKCLLCVRQLPNTNDLTEHYVTFHRVDPNNCFLKISWNVKTNFLNLENAYVVKTS